MVFRSGCQQYSWREQMVSAIFKLLQVLIVLALLSASVMAQQQMPSYRPSTPTLSPYLYLTRPNSGPFPNYQTFVQPLENQRQTNMIQNRQINQLQQTTQQLQDEQYAPSTAAPTGI